MRNNSCALTLSVQLYCFTHSTISFNLLPNDKMLDLSKLKEFADDKLNVAKMMTYEFERAENIVEK